MTEAERIATNRILRDPVFKSNDLVYETGPAVHLNGHQAVAYARNRDNGGDTERNSRQREVLEAMFGKAKDLDVLEYPNLSSMILSECTTSLSDEDMMSLGTWAITSGPKFEEFSLPNEDCNASGQTIGGLWYFVYDLDVASEVLLDFIYERKPLVSEESSIIE